MQTNQLSNFFVLTKIPDSRIQRIVVTQEFQRELSEAFRLQRLAFTNSISDEIKFDGKYRPEDNEMLLIEDFDDIDGLTETAKNPLGYPALTLDNNNVINSICAIFAAFEENSETIVLIQVFNRRRVISNKGFTLLHSNGTFKRLDGDGLTLDGKLTAIMEGRKLKFKNFHFVRQIFDMTAYYKEATDQDLQAFAQHESITMKDGGNLTRMFHKHSALAI